MYALADASGAPAVTRIIRRLGPRAKGLRAANPEGPAKGHVRHFEFALSSPIESYPSQVRAVPSLQSHRHLFRFLSTMWLYRFFLATCAQEDFCLQQYRQEEHCQ